MRKAILSLPPQFLLLGAVISISVWLAAIASNFLLLAIPLLLITGYLAVVDVKTLFFLLLSCIPLSTEVVFSNGFGTDIPTEPIMVGLMGIYLLQTLKYPSTLGNSFLRHPITLLLLLHLGWIAITTITSDQLIVSIKYLLAKTWYVVVFYFMASYFIQTDKDIRRFFWWILIPLLSTMIVVNLRHAAYGFSFEDIYRVLSPFYRNHVAYACIMAVFFPFIAASVYWFWERSRLRNLLLIISIFFLIAIYFSYTRAAYVALLLAGLSYWMVYWRLTKWVILFAVGSLFIGISYLASENRYLEYAPDFERTITHTEFDDLISATYKLEDISTMERVYRWVGGVFMVQEKPWMGFGPGNFYDFYKSYTVNRFRTYVSNNPEQSGIHNYYLMVAVEQGIIGLIWFILLCAAVLWIGEKRLPPYKIGKR
ncbi:MAG: O-antigen ligase family protein [Saprospiraceae bacterium]|nr:O-antigen ligase family protein [Saprospiraceae bacterium]